jgi:hypothetical protein
MTEVEPPPPVLLPNPWQSKATFGMPSFSVQLSGPLRPGKRRTAEVALEGGDNVREVKRVTLVAEKKHIDGSGLSTTLLRNPSLRSQTFLYQPTSIPPTLQRKRTVRLRREFSIPMNVTKLDLCEDDAVRTQIELGKRHYNNSLPPILDDLIMFSWRISPEPWSTRGKHSVQETGEGDAGSSPTPLEQEVKESSARISPTPSESEDLMQARTGCFSYLNWESY